VKSAGNSVCPLCLSTGTSLIYREDSKIYRQCKRCKLCYQNTESQLSASEEKARYDLHENDPADQDYRNFLSQLSEPMIDRLKPGDKGLDFGSGPGPALHIMFEEQGFKMDIYDIYYHPDTKVFQKEYDFITATEVVEHLANPRRELQRLWNCLKPEGYLGIMTKRMVSLEKFRDWHYRKDDTHITFFSLKTFDWLMQNWKGNIDYVAPRVVILKKNY